MAFRPSSARRAGTQSRGRESAVGQKTDARALPALREERRVEAVESIAVASRARPRTSAVLL